jgi:hypothetical protein
MARGDNFKGGKVGGRRKGSLNKRTLEAMEEAQIREQMRGDAILAKCDGRKRAKEVLEDWMLIFQNVAAPYKEEVYQAIKAGRPIPAAALDELERWGTLTSDTARALADFQSPKFRAVQVSAPPTEAQQATPVQLNDDSNRKLLNDPVALTRFYQQSMKRVRG